MQNITVDIPFNIELFSTLDEVRTVHNIEPNSREDESLYSLISNMYHSIFGSHPSNIDKSYLKITEFAKGQWTVVGTSECWNRISFLLIQPGRATSNLPCMLCKVIENPLEVSSEAKHT